MCHIYHTTYRTCNNVCNVFWLKDCVLIKEMCSDRMCHISSQHSSQQYTMSRLLKNICLFCKRALQNRRYSAEETCNFKEPIYIYIQHHLLNIRLVSSLKIFVSFAKEPYKTDDFPQKRPVILRSLLIYTYIYSVLYRLFCRALLQKRHAKETCNFKEPTH